MAWQSILKVRIPAVFVVACVAAAVHPAALFAQPASSSHDQAPSTSSATLDDTFITTTWTNTTTNEVFVQGVNDADIQAITSGIWKLSFILRTVVDDDILQNGSYGLDLVWPGSTVTLATSGDSQTTKDVAWELDAATGHMSLSITMPATGGSSTYTFWETVVVGADTSGEMDGDEPAEATLEKSGQFDAAKQALEWNITACIPAYSSGTCNIWALDDRENYSDIYGLLGDVSHVAVTVTSRDYSGTVRNIDAVGEADKFAYVLLDEGNRGEKILVLNRCTCTSDTCNYWGEHGCGSCAYTHRVNGQQVDTNNHTYVDAAKTTWCDCWHYYYNAIVNVMYNVDAKEVLQKMQDLDVWDLGLIVHNTVYLYRDEAQIVPPSNLAITLHKLLAKEETSVPWQGNAFVGSYEIVVNPHEYSYEGSDCITVMDTMDNLSYLLGTLEVSADNTALMCANGLDNAAEEQLKRDGEAYFRFEIEDQSDGEDITGKALTIQILHPAQRSYTVSYDAAVIKPDKDGYGPYTNTASVGDISAATGGFCLAYDATYTADTKMVALEKIDEDDATTTLAGATFEAYRYCADKDDTLLETISTDKTGRAVLKTNRPAGYILNPNTLYYLVETEAPAGYELNENAAYWFCFKEGEDAVELPEGLLDSDLWGVVETSDNDVKTIGITAANKKCAIEQPEGPEKPIEPEAPVDPEESEVPSAPGKPETDVNPDVSEESEDPEPSSASQETIQDAPNAVDPEPESPQSSGSVSSKSTVPASPHDLATAASSAQTDDPIPIATVITLVVVALAVTATAFTRRS